MIQTHLEIRVHQGQREAALAAFMARRVFEECAEVISGFLGAELLTTDDPDTLYVIAHWQSQAAAGAWMASPVRDAQNADLARFLASPPVGRQLQSSGYALGIAQNANRLTKITKGPAHLPRGGAVTT